MAISVLKTAFVDSWLEVLLLLLSELWRWHCCSIGELSLAMRQAMLVCSASVLAFVSIVTNHTAILAIDPHFLFSVALDVSRKLRYVLCT